ncbi:protein CutA homolog isoform X2 [Melanotaenia boesemani]|uniref:protein CutA homolog isoform X2 n=1 Tax=Melanotaenia boesemani TaxID=1250792 RepID=UPI001C058E8A|nr:protein CutA homolog isoform X2 [Melanotaenia boesemani]
MDEVRRCLSRIICTSRTLRMTVVTNRMQFMLQPCHKNAVLTSAFRSMLLITCLFLVLSVSMYPGLWAIGVQLHAVFTGSYIPGHHSVLLINSPNEQAAKDIGRYYWKGEIQDASEILMLVKTRTSRIQQVIEYVRSVHPYANPEVLSFPVEDGSLAYMKWMDEAIPDD